ncbi:MAG: LysR family transcriptional regulator [Herbaspirillum huttiense]|nr:LysR family transcriptional regulator [Herbaspirillum huttiense]
MNTNATDYPLRVIIFSRVAELGNLAEAAFELRLSCATIGQHIHSLETLLETSLLHHKGEALHLTESGKSFYSYCRHIINWFNEAHENLDSLNKEVDGKVSIAMSSFMASDFLMPILKEFIRTHPRLHIAIDISDAPGELLENGADLALRVGKRNSVDDVLLAELGTILCAAPEYLRTMGPIRQPEDLLEQHLLLFAPNGSEPELTLQDRAGQQQALQAMPRIVTNHAQPLGQLALQGLGVACLPINQIGEDLAAGRLIPVLQEWTPAPLSVFLTSRYKDVAPPRILVCMAHIQAYFQHQFRDGDGWLQPA